MRAFLHVSAGSWRVTPHSTATGGAAVTSGYLV
jgi:hypothetical protein